MMTTRNAQAWWLVGAALFGAGCTCGPSGSSAPLERGPRAEAPSDDPHAGHDHAPGMHPADPHVAAPGQGAQAAEAALPSSAGGIAWRAEEPLVGRRPASSMRAAEYGVREFSEAELTVFYFGADQGGGVDENITRWVDQFSQPDGRSSRAVARIERLEVQGMPVTTVEVSGAFAGMRGMGGGGEARAGFAMLGAIVQGPRGLVFFKLTGSAEAIGAARAAFDALVRSVHPAG